MSDILKPLIGTAANRPLTRAEAEAAFNALFESVRRLSDADAAAIRQRKLSVITVKAGETVASLSARMAYTDFKVERFRILNALGTGAVLKPGDKVKVIISG